MRDNVLLIGLVALGVAGVIFWQSHVDPARVVDLLKAHDSVRAASDDATPPPAAAKPAPAPKSARKAAKVELVAKTDTVAVPVAPLAPVPAQATPVEPIAAVPQEAAAAPAPVEPRAFPSVDQIAVGSQEDSITSAYGDPAVSTLTSAGGHVMETFVYTKDRGHTATVIQLEDGRVAAAYNKTALAPPPGISAPRHF